MKRAIVNNILIGITNAGISDASVVGYALKNLIDVAPNSISVNNQTTTIANLSFTDKIKILSEYVVYIKIK